jgi:electron transport complex protein RnfG
VLSQKETPGLGDKMKTKWKDQFNGKNPKEFNMKVKKDGGEVDAITASTITSRAFCDATQKAYDAYIKNFEVQENKGGAK